MVKVSIIIPVWNQEKLIIKCLDSIPVRDDTEVIVIDDGSTDNTKAAVLEYKRLRVKYIKQRNAGPGVARDNGIRSSNGTYIFLLDSDDWLYTDNFNEVIDKHLNDDYDIVKILRTRNDDERQWYSRVLQGAFVKRSLIGSTRHPEGIRAGEDTVFRKMIEAKKPKINKVPLLVYHYNMPRAGSLTDLHRKGKI